MMGEPRVITKAVHFHLEWRSKGFKPGETPEI